MDTVLFNHLWNKAGNFLSKFKQQEEAATPLPQGGPNTDSIRAMHVASSAAASLYQNFRDDNFVADICETENGRLIVEENGVKKVIEATRGIMIVFTAKADLIGSDDSKSYAEHIAAPGNLSAAEMRNHFETALNNNRTWAEALSDNKREEGPKRTGW